MSESGKPDCGKSERLLLANLGKAGCDEIKSPRSLTVSSDEDVTREVDEICVEAGVRVSARPGFRHDAVDHLGQSLPT
jgi:hypothetical protein